MAGEVASRGRYGDSMLMHVNPAEVAIMEQMVPGSITTNPDTGYPEAFVWSIPMIMMALGAVGGGVAGGVTAKKRDQPWWQGALGGAALGGLGGYGLGALGSGAAGALGAAGGGTAAPGVVVPGALGAAETATPAAAWAAGAGGGEVISLSAAELAAAGGGGGGGSTLGALSNAPTFLSAAGGEAATAGLTAAPAASTATPAAAEAAAKEAAAKEGIGSMIADNPLLVLGGGAAAIDALQPGMDDDEDWGSPYKGPFASWSAGYEEEEEE